MLISSMADKQKVLNPLVHNLQKLGTALKCPSCSNFYEKPMLLPCNHIICSSCLEPIRVGTCCPECKRGYAELDSRQAPYMENLVSIFRSLDADFSLPILQSILSSTTVAGGLVGSSQQMKLSDVEVTPQRIPSSMSQCSQRKVMAGTISGKRVVKRTNDDSDKMHGGRVLATSHSLGFKKPKPNGGMVEKDQRDTTDLIKSKSIVSSDCNPEPTPLPMYDSVDSGCFTCAFCKRWKETEYTGKILHFANGRTVEEDKAAHSGVVHVHQKCLDWSPQIYYANDTLKNLDKELSRAAKLKCAHCGLEGAALGCYVRYCKRSYHVPCAINIVECRWDTENFLLLCPAHSSRKFPSEISVKRDDKSCTIPAQISQDEAPLWKADTGGNKWVLCGSALSVDETFTLIKLASICGAIVMKTWKPNVTHVIAATNSNGTCTRTLEVLSAVLKECWILKIDWVKACMEAMQHVDEEPYEVSIDGFCGGPRMGWLKEARILAGLKFFLIADFVPAYKKGLEDLILAAGGRVLGCKEELLELTSGIQADPPLALIVYNEDSMAGRRQDEARDLAEETGTKAIPHTWLLDSIGSCQQQPFPES